MYSFPIGNGNSGYNDFLEKFTNNAGSGFPWIQQREVFYSIKDGNWTDPTIWQTSSGRVGLIPTSIDDAYVRHNVTVNVISTVNNIYVASSASINSVVTVSLTFNNIKCYGRMFSGGGGFVVLGNDNYINKDLYTLQALTYGGDNQEIMDLPYTSLLLVGTGRKYISKDLVVSGILNVTNSTLDLFGYNLTVSGGTTFAGPINATGPGNYLFVGGVSLPVAGINFVGNPTMEFRGGISVGAGGFTSNLGTGNISFTTNNQSVTSGTNGLLFNNPITIASGITLTFPSNTITTLNNIVNGEDGTSKLVNSGNSSLYFGTQNAAENSMTTGVFDITTNANTVGYTGNYSAIVPSRFPTFHSLTIAGTGTKTLGVNTTLNGILYVGQSGDNTTIFECGSYNLTVNGETRIDGTFSKNSVGNLLFVGLVSVCYTLNITNSYFLLGGNPNVEFRGGFTQTAYAFFRSGSLNTGSGTWTFSTNNQSFNIRGWSTNFSFNANVLVSGNITVSYGGNPGNGSGIIHYGIINGDSANSKFVVVNNLILAGTNITPMAIGIFDHLTNSTSNIWYISNVDQTLPYTTYNLLTIGGVGTKTLSGNTTINSTLYVQSTGDNTTKFECSTYDLTVSGETRIDGTFSKNGAGNLLFIGSLIVCYTTNNQNAYLLLSGNPNVEFRNGFIQAPAYAFFRDNSLNSGTGIWKFITNNQNFNLRSWNSIQNINAKILISGTITVTFGNATGLYFQNIIFNDTIDGDDILSKGLINTSSVITYNSAIQPMITGILDTSTNANTWVYGNSNQDIKGGPTTLDKQVYRNLTLNGGGTKTLQGYVSVLNTYTLTSPAVVNNNGYTLTNP